MEYCIMTQATILMENEALQKLKESLSHFTLTNIPLRTAVREFLQYHFLKLESTQSTQLYELMLAEMEIPLLEMMLHYCKHNQTRAAKLLDISRGTLRQKMRLYGLLTVRRRKIT